LYSTNCKSAIANNYNLINVNYLLFLYFIVTRKLGNFSGFHLHSFYLNFDLWVYCMCKHFQCLSFLFFFYFFSLSFI